MATVVVSATVKALEVSAALVVKGYKVEVTGAVEIPAQVVSVPLATFPDVPAGDWVAKVTLVDDQDKPIGETQSAAFTIAPPMQTVSVPDVVSVQVS